MVDILHRIGVKAPLAEVYSALTTAEGLAAWWTDDTTGEGGATGGVLQFRFEEGGFDMKVLDLAPNEHVLWEVIDGPEEWIGTHIDWRLERADEYTIVLFQHQGWRQPVEFMYHCSTKWAAFLLSLKSLLETGQGAPNPNDVRLGNWK
ncbi:SRPBCC domain-containing protein [Aldersonia sp. NBC_00410]|uniref:SRPBCC family protein n=1 Tax=Aldersonia sp. NBC_00410 TaxID=2975954 RepID=UPI002255C46D|nr:SRPBCC domain-containing protein [Aldersonia sp. NBC_00410]MCX5045096.1 SRPBCC domain-containing protein [Aldersonia sp. NBC_00410]